MSGGGWNSVAAEILLLKQAIHKGSYDRFVFLQGADYPIKSGKEIRAFFEAHKDVEFIRGCCCTTSDDYYLRCRCWSIWFYNNYSHFTLLKKIWNRLTKQFKIELRNGFAYGDNLKHPVYWGSAQWAITKGLAVYFIEFFDNHPNYNKWYYNAFPADEIYFTTIAFNSPFRNNTTAGGPEPELRGLANWRNLHYFEYLPGRIKVFEESDITLIRQLEELYIRKVTTEQSSKLLDLIDYSERE